MAIDVRKSAEKSGIRDHMILKSFMKDFFRLCQGEIDKLPTAFEKHDKTNIVRRAHNIEISASRLHLEDIAGAAKKLESCALSDEELAHKAFMELVTVFTKDKEDFSKAG